jgi:hypothetical protein
MTLARIEAGVAIIIIVSFLLLLIYFVICAVEYQIRKAVIRQHKTQEQPAGTGQHVRSDSILPTYLDGWRGEGPTREWLGSWMLMNGGWCSKGKVIPTLSEVVDLLKSQGATHIDAKGDFELPV